MGAMSAGVPIEFLTIYIYSHTEFEGIGCSYTG